MRHREDRNNWRISSKEVSAQVVRVREARPKNTWSGNKGLGALLGVQILGVDEASVPESEGDPVRLLRRARDHGVQSVA
jgi:hypothetical protein